MEAASSLAGPPPLGVPNVGAARVPHARPSAQVALWTVAGVVALVLVWRIVVVNVSAMFALEAETTPAAAARAVAWDAANAEALVREADTLVERDPARAEDLARRALVANPASARAWLVLARGAAAAGQTQAYADYLAHSAELEPQNAATRLALADLALRQNNAEAALENLDAAIRARPELAPELYPQLLALLGTEAGESSLRKLFAHDIPKWWPAFFAYASARAASVIVPLRLLDIRRSFDPSPAVAERQPVVARLAHENEWEPAFLVWLNGLSPEQRRAAGNVYNGGFETPFTGTTFDWRLPARNGVEVEALPTFGTGGARALRLAFQGQVSTPRLIAQTLLLDPDYTYELRARYRLESLRTQFGLQWEITCGAEGSPQVLGTGERLVGTSDWRELTVKFAVPAECYPQQLALVLRGDAKLDLQATGLVWYDDVSIIRGIPVTGAKIATATEQVVPSITSANGGTPKKRGRR